MSSKKPEAKPQDVVMSIGNLLATALDVAQGLDEGRGLFTSLGRGIANHERRAKALKKQSRKVGDDSQNSEDSATSSAQPTDSSVSPPPQRVKVDVRPILFCDCCKLPPAQCHARDASH